VNSETSSSIVLASNQLRKVPAWKDPTALPELYRLVGTIPWWVLGGVAKRTERIPLTIDTNREAEIVEGWTLSFSAKMAPGSWFGRTQTDF